MLLEFSPFPANSTPVYQALARYTPNDAVLIFDVFSGVIFRNKAGIVWLTFV
jgi:hypothetical protein